MRRAFVIVAVVLFLAAIAAMIVPMWIATAGIDLPPAGVAAIVLMILGCFGVGGGLMFLIFHSARHGYDDAAHDAAQDAAGGRTHGLSPDADKPGGGP